MRMRRDRDEKRPSRSRPAKPQHRAKLESIAGPRTNRCSHHPQQEAHLTAGNGVQIIGKVNPDLSIKVLTSLDLGTGVGGSSISPCFPHHETGEWRGEVRQICLPYAGLGRTSLVR
jgi:hypothetical protein